MRVPSLSCWAWRRAARSWTSCGRGGAGSRRPGRPSCGQRPGRRGDVSCQNRRRHAVSSLVVCARAEMVAAFLAQRSRRPGIALLEEVSLATVVLCLLLLGGGLRLLDPVWYLGEKLVCYAETALRKGVAPPVVFGSAQPPDLFDPAGPVRRWTSCFQLCFSARLWPPADRGRLFVELGRGRPCGRGRGFIPESGESTLCRAAADWRAPLPLLLNRHTGATLVFDEQGVVFVSCSRPIFGLPRWVRARNRVDGPPSCSGPHGRVVSVRLRARTHASVPSRNTLSGRIGSPPGSSQRLRPGRGPASSEETAPAVRTLTFPPGRRLTNPIQPLAGETTSPAIRVQRPPPG